MAEVRVRRATVVDAAELVRLRLVMLADMGADTSVLPAGWVDCTVAVLEARLSDTEEFAAFVVDHDLELASCAIAWLVPDLPAPWSPDGTTGNVANVVTDDRFRRRGFGRAVTLAAQEWLAARGVKLARLMATPSGAPLYRELGWGAPAAEAMVLRLNR